MTGVINSPQPDLDYDVASISVAPRTPVSPPVSLPDEALPTDLQSRSTYVTVVSDQLPVLLEEHPSNSVATAPPAVHQGTPNLDSDIALDVTEPVATNYSQGANTPPAMAGHSPHSIASDPGIVTREPLAYLGIEPSHDFDRPR